MAKQTKREVKITEKTPSYGYKRQWYHDASPTKRTPFPDPYIVSEAKDGNWSCACMNWTRTHPREDCKHIMRVKMKVSAPAQIVPARSTQVEFTGRVFR